MSFIQANEKLKLSRNTLQEFACHDETKTREWTSARFILCSYRGKTIEMGTVLFDTGCASTIFDTDLLAKIELHLDMMNGTAKRMHGVGGASELCYELVVEGLQIGSLVLPLFKLQLGMTKEPYGFDGILGIDFMTTVGLKVDFKKMTIAF